MTQFGDAQVSLGLPQLKDNSRRWRGSSTNGKQTMDSSAMDTGPRELTREHPQMVQVISTELCVPQKRSNEVWNKYGTKGSREKGKERSDVTITRIVSRRTYIRRSSSGSWGFEGFVYSPRDSGWAERAGLLTKRESGDLHTAGERTGRLGYIVKRPEWRIQCRLQQTYILQEQGTGWRRLYENTSIRLCLDSLIHVSRGVKYNVYFDCRGVTHRKWSCRPLRGAKCWMWIQGGCGRVNVEGIKPRENAARSGKQTLLRPRANAALWGMLGMMVRVVYGYGWFTGFAGPDVTACRHYANCQRVNTQPPWLLRHPTLQVSARRLLCSGPGNSQEAKFSLPPLRKNGHDSAMALRDHGINTPPRDRGIDAAPRHHGVDAAPRHHSIDAAPRRHGVDAAP
ncbi:hypothetical protein EDB85DRAFT_1890333 [Lactarius pseudohatsudake]|nr:hypothetical protein EDB85DRAFT_1890333 [Lactarius pseudohatsudake]